MNQKKKKTCKIVDFAVPADYKIKLKGSEKKMTIIPMMIGAFGTVTEGLLQGLEDLEAGGRVETIQATAFFEQEEYLEMSWKLKETYVTYDSVKSH